VAEVFTSTARHLICDGSDLDLLCIAACQKRTLDGVSSWVPIFGGAYERFIFALCRPPFYTAGSTTAVVNSSDVDPNILSVKGTVVDMVKTMTTARPAPTNLQRLPFSSACHSPAPTILQRLPFSSACHSPAPSLL
jgi:hypothetical protein